jgi:beta-phosphoglucomutase-like phosphatase (HAD superfamily)
MRARALVFDFDGTQRERIVGERLERYRAIADGSTVPEEVAFEDTETGVAAAKGAGLVCFAVAGTHAPERLAAADELVPALDVALVRRLLG